MLQEAWLQRQLCIARVCLGLHEVDFEGAEPLQPAMDSPGKVKDTGCALHFCKGSWALCSILMSASCRCLEL